MKFSQTETHESKLYPGVRFVVRRLNEIQRARRDERMLEAKGRITEHQIEAEKHKEAATSDSAAAIKWQMANARLNLTFESEIIPEYIRSGLVAIEGLDGDQGPITKDTLIDNAPDGLLSEIYDACRAASEMTAEQLKNSQPRSTSSEAEPQESPSTTAPAVAP